MTQSRLLAAADNADDVAPVATGLLRTASEGVLYDAAGVNWDRALGVAGAALVDGPRVDDAAFTVGTHRVFPMGAFAGDVALDSVQDGDTGIPLMTVTRVLNAVLTDPTTITQRQRVLAAAATQSETATQYALVAAVLYGHDTAAAAASQLVKVEGESTASPNLRVSLWDGEGEADVAAPADGLVALNGVGVIGQSHLYNATNWDRERNNQDVTLLASGSDIAAGRTGAAITNYNWVGLLIALDITVVNGTGSFTTLNIQVQGPGAGNWVTIYQWTGLALVTTGTRFFQIYPGAASPGQFTQPPLQGAMPRTFRVNTVTATDGIGNNLSYECEAQFIL